MKTLVAYYSLQGNTKIIAERVSKELNADLLRIEPLKDIPSSGSKRLIVGGFKTAFKIFPQLKPININFDDYDRIILGTPIWVGVEAISISSFLKKCNINNKVIAVFTSSGSGFNEKCINKFKKLLPNMKETVSLVSTENDKQNENDRKLSDFIQKLKID